MLKSTILRIVAFSVLFAYALPFGFKVAGFESRFAFQGGVITAAALGVAYMLSMFAVALAWTLATALLGLRPTKKLWTLTGATILGATALFLLNSQSFGLMVTGWLPALVGGAVSVAILHLTMWGSAREAAG